jgi:hypothetical protein
MVADVCDAVGRMFAKQVHWLGTDPVWASGPSSLAGTGCFSARNLWRFVILTPIIQISTTTPS